MLVQVTVGEEGFFAPGDPHVSCNPAYPSTWPQYEGQDFTNNHRSKDIDFTVRTETCPPRRLEQSPTHTLP